jgi:hypothetical protein
MQNHAKPRSARVKLSVDFPPAEIGAKRSLYISSDVFYEAAVDLCQRLNIPPMRTARSCRPLKTFLDLIRNQNKSMTHQIQVGPVVLLVEGAPVAGQGREGAERRVGGHDREDVSRVRDKPADERDLQGAVQIGLA